MKRLTPRAFLRRIWRAQRSDGYGFITWFDQDRTWHEMAVEVKAGESFSLKLPNEGRDLYFTPNLFSEPHRQKQYVIPGRWLYADLDPVDPTTLEYLPPTAAWETSPERFQALWRLEKRLRPDRLLDLNQKLTYLTGADKGNWKATQVLRIPGTVSLKRADPWLVKPLWFDRTSYSFSEVHALCRNVKTPASLTPDVKNLSLPREKPSSILKRYRLSPRAKKLLLAKTGELGDRSQRLWELENLLLDTGMSPEEVLVVVKATRWNKYRGQNRELNQLWTEINKAVAHRSQVDAEELADEKPKKKRDRKKKETAEQKAERARELNLLTYDQFLRKKLPKPRWLVESIWSDKAHGIMAGEAKVYKSVIATDLAVSVASGARFLDYFQIPKTGPVMMIQEENDPGEVQDRLQRIAHSKALAASASFRNGRLTLMPDRSLPITLLNNENFDLTSNDDLKWLQRQVKKLKPELLVLDPLYLMTPGLDENSAAQMTPVLRALLRIKQKYGVGILIIHHYHKQSLMNPRAGMERMSGTGVFGRWFESALYVERTDDPFTSRLVPDHRAHAPQGVLYASFDLGTPDDLHYAVEVTRPREEESEKHGGLDALLHEKDEWTVAELRRRIGVSSKKLEQMLADHGYGVEERRSGTKGRPKKLVVPHGGR